MTFGALTINPRKACIHRIAHLADHDRLCSRAPNDRGPAVARCSGATRALLITATLDRSIPPLVSVPREHGSGYGRDGVGASERMPASMQLPVLRFLPTAEAAATRSAKPRHCLVASECRFGTLESLG
jgi:hypothetical protein